MFIEYYEDITLRELRQYIRALIYERVRPRQFDMNEFRTIVAAQRSSHNKRHFAMKYCNNHLSVLGAGSSRATFRFSSRFAIKVAMNRDGISQNTQELEVHSNEKLRKLLTKIVEHDEHNTWMMVEIVRELQSEKEFFEMIGMPKHVDVSMSQFMWFVDDPSDGLIRVKRDGKMTLENLSEEYENFSPELKQFILDLRELIHDGNLYKIELAVDNHWGKTADGRLVLLDYGISNDYQSGE